MTDLAFAGAGRITAVHGLVAEALAGVHVSRVASRTPATAAARARQLGARPATYADLPGGADVVFVTTPPSHHREAALAALGAGAAVVVEKPLATTLADADALVAAAAANAHRLGYAENLAFAPVVMRAASMTAALGPLRHLDARMLSSRPDWGDFLTAGWGGGALFDLGAHPLAVVLLLADAGPGGADRVVEVRGQLERSHDLVVDDHAQVDLVFASGLHARVEASWRDADRVVDFQAASDHGVVRGELVPNLALERDGVALGLPESRADLAFPDLETFGYLGQLEDFLADFAASRAPEIGAEFGRLVLEITCAAYASAGHGDAPVPLPFAGPRDATPLQLWRG